MGTTALNFDVNASYGAIPGVIEEATALCAGALNASSVHRGGQAARRLIEEARDRILAALGIAREARVIFTSGATEANNTALMSPFWPELGRTSSRGLVTTRLEHPSVLECARRLEELGVSVRYLNSRGRALVDAIRQAVDMNTALVSVMCANNETGEVFPVSEIACQARLARPDVLVHSDGVQAFGKMPLSWQELQVDMLSLSGHKIGALPGVGALIVRSDLVVSPLLLGGPQEQHRRAGTENVLGIVSFGIAAKLLREEGQKRWRRFKNARDILLEVLKARIPMLVLNSANDEWLPNTLSVRFPGVRADDLVLALDLKGILVSSGAACASGKPEPSHVLLAIGLSHVQAKETIRISVRADAQPEEVLHAGCVIADTVNSMHGERRP